MELSLTYILNQTYLIHKSKQIIITFHSPFLKRRQLKNMLKAMRNRPTSLSFPHCLWEDTHVRNLRSLVFLHHTLPVQHWRRALLENSARVMASLSGSDEYSALTGPAIGGRQGEASSVEYGFNRKASLLSLRSHC